MSSWVISGSHNAPRYRRIGPEGSSDPRKYHRARGKACRRARKPASGNGLLLAGAKAYLLPPSRAQHPLYVHLQRLDDEVGLARGNGPADEHEACCGAFELNDAECE
jgi:hypothetical protein